MKKNVSLIAFVLLLAAAFVFVMIRGTEGVKESTQQNGINAIHQAVMRAAVNCYSIEGAYPSNLDYLKENYGLRYDEGHYLVSYDAFASNLLPDVFVFERGGAEVGS